MAYMDQDKKRQLVQKAKLVLQKYDVKATFGVRHHSTLVCNIKSGSINFIANHRETLQRDPFYANRTWNLNDRYIDVNVYHFKSQFSGKALAFLTELLECLNDGNWDKSDAMTDYFNVGWYVDVNIGNWEKPYVLEE